MNFIDVLVKTLQTQKINTAIFASLAIILFGYYLRKKKFLMKIQVKYLQK